MKKLLFLILLLTLAMTSCSTKEIIVGNNTCILDSDCTQHLSCGCHTQDIHDINSENAMKWAEQGMLMEPCAHLANSYCVCENNKCLEKFS